MEICDLVFVYGTLKKGYGNSRLLSSTGAEYVGPRTTKDKYVLGDIGFPYAFPKDKVEDLFEDEDMFRQVKGDLWRLTDPLTLSSLDALEGIKYDHYQRILTETSEGEECWMYIQLDKTRIFDCYQCNIEGGYWVWP